MRTIEESEKYYAEVLSYTLEKKPEKPLTLFDISGNAHYEDICSNWYAFFLDPQKEHGFGTLFLDSLTELINSKSNKTNDLLWEADSFTIIREHFTGRGSIDLLIAERDTKDSYRKAVIIENKIYAALNNDLEDYYSSIKVSDENKRGVVLSLYPLETNHTHFVNITHSEWLKKINAGLGNYWQKAGDKYLMFLRDFILNLESMGESTEGMNADLKFYMQHASKINELCQLQIEALGFLAESISLHLDKSGWEWQRSYDGYVSLQYSKNSNFRGYLYFDELFDKHQFKFALWIVEDTMEAWKRLSIEDIVALEAKYANQIDIKNKRQSKAWIHIGEKMYTEIEQNEIENFGVYVDSLLADQWEKLLEEINILCSKK
ncbi:PD-(D/E)XK nuclease family protein [Xanthocytophaga agilis]|uniref:PD-(D/E)XK nuclease family protein n=1 Tax=Xanthocytophaga agilis TaxID=3048010 RepID=A0AAE3RBV0_9BACT|nr:PD-(D/E)XK nuclease family protein [Xanthocytophaga agilis]MDJ1505420.1 PD-(D/E)XK nuclease family protein [Xanthocytophaga agilis]